MTDLRECAPVEQVAVSPLPWRVDEKLTLANPGGQRIVRAADHGKVLYAAEWFFDRRERAEMDANAEFIVRACNSHNDLLAALKALLNLQFDHVSPFLSIPNGREILAQADAAIAKAEAR